MKSKKGFTLIELLAIIVILAIIAVITVPIILNIIDNSKKGAATDSAYGYKDAVNKWYISKLQEDSGYTLNGNYNVSDGKLNNIEIPISGSIPTNGTLTYSNNELTGGCLTIGDYKVTFDSKGNVSETVKGECDSSSTAYLYVNKEIIIFSDLYIVIWDDNVGEYGGYVKSQDKLQISDGTTTRPNDKNVYLKFELTNGGLDSNKSPEACIYSETHGGELCLKINEFETSTQKIRTYFGYDASTWIQDENDELMWYNDSNKTISCTDFDEEKGCIDLVFGADAMDFDGYTSVMVDIHANGYVGPGHYISDFTCSVDSDGIAQCN